MRAMQMPGFEGGARAGHPESDVCNSLDAIRQFGLPDGSQSDQPGCDTPEQQHTLQHHALSTTGRARAAAY